MVNAPSSHILIFTRYPVPGKAKTRLIPALGPEGAARLHRRMAEHAVNVARAALRGRCEGDADITIWYTGAPVSAFRKWLGDDLRYAPQSGGDLGDRMCQAFGETFRKGAKAALLVGSDLPDLTAGILCRAIEGLMGHDIVLGPATDGGYYLIGMKSPHPELFTGIDWGTEKVCEQTRDAIKRLGLSAQDLPQLCDVDLPEDLELTSCSP